MENKENIEKLLSTLDGARQLSALELNDIRFSGRKTIITPKKLRSKK